MEHGVEVHLEKNFEDAKKEREKKAGIKLQHILNTTQVCYWLKNINKNDEEPTHLFVSKF